VAETSYRIGWLAAATIVALRVGIGVHFLGEGLSKVSQPRPFSAAFFGNAKGPLAPLYTGLVWDPDGEYRLDLNATLSQWDDYRNRVVSHYGFDDKQKKAADQTLKTYEARLKQHISSNREDIDEYYKWVERRKANKEDPTRQLASLQRHDDRIEADALKLYAELIPPIDLLWKELENDLNALASQEQWERHGRLAIGKPGRRAVDSETLDRVIPWFDIGVGACLILGLFTRPAAALGAAFLASVCLSQWPASPGAMPIYNQFVEMLALLALAAIGAGRFLGIDFLFGGLKQWCCPAKSTGEAI
jgi:uncharacterized membrane protein YphA (DoxX/SURF4 family)